MIGATALWLMYAWLAAAIVASYLSNRKGYGEKPGLASGLLLHVIGVIIWLVVPAKAHSKWKMIGPFGRRKAEDIAPRAAASAPTVDTDGNGGDDDRPGSRAASA
jgi:hypothetical protein